MKISLLVAMSENNVIGKDNQLIWHLPEDLKLFKRLTMGHHMIMGRKTFESIGKLLPGRTTIIITRDKSYTHPGSLIAYSLDEALDLAKNDDEVFIIGGGQIFKESLDIADKIYLTQIYHHFEGDVYFPEIDFSKWKRIKREDHEPDEKNPYFYSFCELEKIK